MVELWISLQLLCIGFIAFGLEDRKANNARPHGSPEAALVDKSSFPTRVLPDESVPPRHVDLVFLKTERPQASVVASRRTQKS